MISNPKNLENKLRDVVTLGACGTKKNEKRRNRNLYHPCPRLSSARPVLLKLEEYHLNQVATQHENSVFDRQLREIMVQVMKVKTPLV
ncbi:hypothetical protein D9B85_11320 [Corynebacterium diphtheriae]|nr:hypothetical protein B1A51_09700 [Corynebacterium diphtheriae]RKX00199.1 hypothetical protein D9B85_11320 [Corynebacterium diphtheriae]